MSSQHATSKSSLVQSSAEPVSTQTSSPSSSFHTLPDAQASTYLKSVKRKRSVDKNANESNESCASPMSFDDGMVKALLSSLQARILQSNNKAAVAVRKAAPPKIKYLCTPQRMKIEYQRLWRDYQVFQAYRSQDSFSVDQRGVVSGDSRAIGAHMKAHPEAAKSRDRPLDLKEELDELFDAIFAQNLPTSNRTRAELEPFDSIEKDSDASSANKSILTSNMRRRDALVKSEQPNDAASSYVETESETYDSEDSESSATDSLASETLEAAVIAAARVVEAFLARRTGYSRSYVARAGAVLSSGRFDLSEEDCCLAATILMDTANAEIFLGVPPEHQQAMLQHFIDKEKAKRGILKSVGATAIS